MLALICLLSFLVNYGRVAFAPLVDHFIATGATPALAGLVATAVWVGSAAPRLPTGYLLTFIRRHIIILGSAWWLCVGAFFTALSPSVHVAIVAAFFFGLSTGIFYVAANPLVAEMFPQRVGVVLGVRGMFSQIGAVVAPFVVGLAIAFGAWQWSFIGLAAAGVVTTIMFWGVTRVATLPDAGRGDRDLLGGIRTEWRLIAAGLAFVGLTGFVWQGVFNFYVTFLGAEVGVTTRQAAQLLTITFAAGIPSFLVFGRLADRISFLRIILTIMLVFSLCLYGLTLANSLLVIALVSMVMGFMIHGLFPVGDAYLLATLPDERRASAYSGYSATMMLAQAPGSVVVGLLVQSGLTYAGVFQGFAVAVLVLTAGMWILSRMHRIPTGR